MTSVTVVMPVFNAMPYLQSSIDSVLNQTLDDAYLLIVDDGSVDGSYEYVKGVRDRRVRVMLQPHKGPGAAMNAALEHVETQYLARMDADDIAMPTRLEKQVALLEAHPEVLACSCNSYYINRAGQIIGSSTVPISPGLIAWEIRTGLRGLVQGATCFRTSALRKIGGYRDQFRCAEDTDLFVRLSSLGPLANCRDYLYKIRLHDDSLSLTDPTLNALYSHYALYCFHQRAHGRPESSFESFLAAPDPHATFRRWAASLDVASLQAWRSAMVQSRTSVRVSQLLLLFVAALLSPQRVVARMLRSLEQGAEA